VLDDKQNKLTLLTEHRGVGAGQCEQAGSVAIMQIRFTNSQSFDSRKSVDQSGCDVPFDAWLPCRRSSLSTVAGAGVEKTV
jgi:hypothetical protein